MKLSPTGAYPALSAALMLAAQVCLAANGTWFSTNAVARNTYWTNSWNWSAQPGPAGNQTATFNNSVNTTNTTINLEGLTFGCSNIVFDTSGCAAYTLGSNGVSQQTLSFTNNSGVRLSSTVTQPQRIDAALQLGFDRTASTHTFRNEQPLAPLILAGNVSAPNNSGTGGTKTMLLNGLGDFRIHGNISTNGYSPFVLTDTTYGSVLLTGVNTINTLNANAGPLTVVGTNRIVTYSQTSGNATLWGSNHLDTITVTGGSLSLIGSNRVATLNQNGDVAISSSGTNVIYGQLNINGTGGAVFTVASGVLAFSNGGNGNLVATSDATVNGPGDIQLSVNGTDYANNSVPVGKTFTINARLTGPAGFEMYAGSTSTTNGTFVLTAINDFLLDVKFNASHTLVVSKIGNKGSTTSNLGRGSIIDFNSASPRGGILVYTGDGETSDRTLSLNNSATIDHSGTGLLKFNGVPTASGNSKTLTLQGSTAGVGEMACVIPVGGGTSTALIKNGTGTWNLTTNNLYAGTTTVNAGTLALSGAAGAALASTGYVLNGGLLALGNTAAANNTNRLSDTAAITFNGGTLLFSNDGGATNFSENAGALTLNPGIATVATAQAAAGRTATLRFSSLVRNPGGSVNFTGAGLGADGRNRIFFTSGVAEGLIGPWATVNGTSLAAYSAANGVYAATDAAFTDIAARGPSTIVSNDASVVRINLPGEDGPIALSDSVTRISSLVQNTAIAATVDTADKTLQTAGIAIPAGKAAVTIGVASGDGTLSALQANGELAFNNASALTVNAALADSGQAAKITKSGNGLLTLTASNTFAGSFAAGGPLALAHAYALQSATLAAATGSVFDSSVASHAFTLGNISGAFSLPLADNDASPSPVALTVGSNGGSTFHGGSITGAGSLSKVGDGTLTLSGLSSFSGGLTVSGGTVVASNAFALGVGGVVNNGTINLPVTGGTLYYSGISNAMSGAGTVNVWLATGGSTTYLIGDYSGFTGVWNIGTNAPAGSAKVLMTGLDNPAASINVLPNGTLYYPSGTHAASVTLRGGDTGEAYGQLRIESGAVLTGPLTLAGAITTTIDGTIGASSGLGTLSGTISETGGSYGLSKVGAGTNHLTGANTYAGPTWIKNGGLRVDTLGSVGGGASALGSPSSLAEGTVKFGTVNTNGTLVYTGQGETSDRQLELAGTANNTATIWHAGSNTLTLTGNVISTLDFNKQLRLHGTTVGATGVLAGVFSDYGAGSTNNLYKAGPVTWTLANNNTFKGNVVVEDGALRVTSSGAFGDWPKYVQAANNANGCNPHIHFDGSQGNLTFPTSITFRTSNTRVGAIFNEGGTNTIRGPLHLTSGDGDTILNSVSGKLVVEGNVWPPSDATRQLRLQGDGDGEISGVIDNGATANMPVYRMVGNGTWTLSASNTYSGATYVNNGTLVIGGAAGFIGAGTTVNPSGTLVVANSALQNRGNRLSDTATVTLAGGVFNFSHAGGAADYSETAGPLAVAAGSNTVATAQADESQTSVMTFASLTRSGNATLNFQGEGLGVDSRNKVMFSTPPATGIIGLWATYNVTNIAAYDSTLGVVAAGDGLFTDLTAKGPALIPNSAALNARINSEGTEGVIGLEGATTTSVKSLLQNTDWASTVGMTNQTLLVNDIMIGPGRQDLTLGTVENEGLVMPQTSGGTLTLINASSSALTVNAGVTNNGATGTKVVKAGPGTVKLAGRSSYTGTTTINEGTLEFGNGLTQTVTSVIGGAGGLTKSGAGRVTLSGANTYQGVTTIKSGTLLANNNACLGGVLGGTVIEAGATLDVASPNQGSNLDLGDEAFTISGDGVNGRGAIINSSGGTIYGYINKVTLAGDTTVGGDGGGRWDIRRNRSTITPSLVMNGYTLTKVSSNFVGITAATVTPGSGNIDIREGTLTLETSTTLGGSAANTVTVRNGGTFDIYNLAAPVAWSVVMEENSRFNVRNANATNVNIQAGPVTLNGRAVFDGSNPTTDTIAGDIGGVGSVVKTGAGVSTYFTSPNNTYGGTTTISNGTLYAKYPGSLPGYAAGKLSVLGGGTIGVFSGDGATGWSLAQILDMYNFSTFQNNAAGLAIDTTLGSVDFSSNLTKPLALTKNGVNTLTLNGTNTFSGALTVNAGALTFASGSTNFTGNVTVNNAGVLAFNGPAYNTNGTLAVNSTGVLIYGSGTTNDAGAATVNNFGALTFAAGSTSTVAGVTAKGSCTVSVNGSLSLRNKDMTAGNASGDRPTVIFNNNAFLNKLYVGNGLGSAGAVIQNAGALTVTPAQGGQDVLSLGLNGGYGYYQMNGGTLTVGQFAITGNAPGQNSAVVDQYNGDIVVSSSGGWLIWGWQNGFGIYNMFGGSIANPPSGNHVEMHHSAGRSAYAALNMLGASARFNSTVNARIFQLSGQPGNAGSVLNLNAGTLIANQVVSTYSSTTPTFLNFGGGTLRANTAQTQFVQGMSFMTAYPGGAVIDSTNVAITVNQSLLAPTGYGLSGVTVLNGGLGYCGAPVVQITGGTGTGATAIATVDLNPASASLGKVTGVTVTSPGFGYSAGDLLTVKFIGGGFTNNISATASASLSPNSASGGLTKRGAGTLTLGGTNTYGGTTAVAAGTLKLALPTSLPSGTAVDVASGATLDLNGLTATNTFSGAGAISNGAIVTVFSPAGAGTVGTQTLTLKSASATGTYLADVTLAGACDLLTVQGNVDLSGIALEIVNTDALNRHIQYTIFSCTGTRTGSFSSDNIADPRWKLVYQPHGTVKLIFVDGTFIKVY